MGTPVNGVSQDRGGPNELSRLLQQRLHVVEGGGMSRAVVTDQMRERSSLGSQASTSPRTSLPNGTRPAVVVDRAQPRQFPATYVTRGGYSFPSTQSGSTSPAYPWALAYAGPSSNGGSNHYGSGSLTVPRSGDSLSRSAPGGGSGPNMMLGPGRYSTNSRPVPQVGVRNTVEAFESKRLEKTEAHAQSIQHHLHQCNGLLRQGSELSENTASLLTEINAMKSARSEVEAREAEAKAGMVKAEERAKEYEARFNQEALERRAAKEEVSRLAAENENLRRRDRSHVEAEETLRGENAEFVKQSAAQMSTRSVLEEERNNARLEADKFRQQWIDSEAQAEPFRRKFNEQEAENRDIIILNQQLQLTLEQVSKENQALSSLSGASCSGCRLRATLTKQSASIEELKSAIAGVDSLLEQARRELKQQELRAKRAAIEELHQAMLKKLDEEALKIAIERAIRAGVADEDVQKAQNMLDELLSLTPEEKQLRLDSQHEKARKEEAFTFAKRDRVMELEKLLDELGEGVAWEQWHDSQGRTLLRVAQHLRSERAIKVLEERIERRHPGTMKPAETHRRLSKELPHRMSTTSSQDETGSVVGVEVVVVDGITRQRSRDMSELPSGVGLTRQGSREMARATSGASAGRPSEVSVPAAQHLQLEMTGAMSSTASVPPSPGAAFSRLQSTEDFADGGAIGSAASLQPPSPGLAPPPPSTSWRSWYEDDLPAKSSTAKSSTAPAPVPEETESVPAISRLSVEEEDKLKTEAFRACASGNAERLLEVLDGVPVNVWERWQNKAGKDLEQLCQERGEKCEVCLRVIFKASGRETQIEREYFEEGEHIWVHVKGEVQARQATVMEDTPIEEDLVLIQFWAGYEDSSYVDRGVVSKMYSR